jgi:hypothetical protein
MQLLMLLIKKKLEEYLDSFIIEKTHFHRKFYPIINLKFKII